MTYYWLGSPVPRFIERIYIACITQHDKCLDLDLPYPEPVTADEMRADLDCIYNKYDWILNGGIPNVGKDMIYDPLSAVWDALVTHRANLEKLLDKYGDQVVPPIRGNCFTMWKAIRPYLRTQWKGSSARDWERKRTIAKLLMNLRGYPDEERFPFRGPNNNTSSGYVDGTTLPPYKA